ncbi:molybdate ABC transporter substrate-binding protein [Shumkonia mesophila]|uniref:molybdate ABC transporter substrate-binding protein n=1 Tax=Shumkonia mesophila TaxID=2838854 RepID=UPI0029344D2C|nr:molybdate ABC transporter substrate-binding protein [Shumkonia mesophila]
MTTRQSQGCRRWAAMLGLALLPLLVGTAGAAEVRLFAAASTTTVLDEIATLYAAQGPDRVVASYASSSTLAKQIVNGAPADIFISASGQWMDYAIEKKAIEASTRRDLLNNRLVLVAPADSRWSLDAVPGFGLAGVLGEGYLAMGDPDHVPAGIYGRQALTQLGVWESVAGRVARAADVRAALALVERGEAVAGIVYSTDAAVTPKVRIVSVFPETSHPPIRYPAAIVAGHDTAEVRRFFDFLMSEKVGAIYQRYGFGLASAPATR